MNSVNVARGHAVRRAILAIAKLCVEQNKQLPTCEAIGRSLGCDHVRVWHHIERLRADGALVAKRGARNRLNVLEVRL